jgi:hypothetical protein
MLRELFDFGDMKCIPCTNLNWADSNNVMARAKCPAPLASQTVNMRRNHGVGMHGSQTRTRRARWWIMHIGTASDHTLIPGEKKPMRAGRMGFVAARRLTAGAPRITGIYFSSGPFNCGKPAPLPIDNNPVLK